MSAPPLLSYRGVVAGWTAPVVGPISFDLSEGELVALVGPNGCGKSTLIGAFTGAARTFSGLVAKREGATAAVQRQHPVREAEIPLNGHELLKLTGAHHRPPPPILSPLLDSRIDRLSGGQFQILSVWACLASDAAIVILDEPTNNMATATVEMLVPLLEASRPGRGILVVTHDERFLSRAAGRRVEVAP